MRVSASTMIRILFCFLTLLLVSFGIMGQANRASITGTVTDASGGVMAGVDITARNTETNIETSTVSNGDGIYALPNLPPGTYALTFRKTGFKEIQQSEITLISTQVAKIDVAMQVGAASENVTVTAEAPVLDSESVSVGTNMNGKVVTDLPLSIYGGGRFVEDFAVAITPGYSPISSPYGAVVNGSQWFTKDFTIDGTSGTASIRGNSMETGPSMEAVSELQAQTSGLDSASAITNGGVMSFTLKSGTNQFHGSAFGLGHNEFLDANTWTNDFNGDPKAKARAWDYGGSLGGPILKNKLFFFGAFERYTQSDFTLGGYSAFVPTPDMLNGNFSALLGAPLVDENNNPVINPCTGQQVITGQIFDPTTKQTVGGQACYVPFTNNTIDPSRFSSVSKQINGLFQQYYAPERAGLNDNNRITKSNSPDQTPNQAVVKLDYDLTSRDKLSGSWIYNNRPRTLVDSGGVWQAGSSDGGPLSTARVQRVNSDQYRLNETHSFTPNVLNVLNFTYNWYKQGDVPAAGGNWNSQLGFTGAGASNFPLISFGNSINGYGVTYIGNTFQGSSSGATIITGDTVTWTKGRHTMSFGGDFRAYQVNSHKGQGALSFSFVPNDTDGGYPGVAGFGFASYLLGTVSTASQTTPFDLYGRRKAMTLFAQDSYKVTPKLTLTGGLRWQYARRYHEKYGHWANYDLTQIDPNYGYPGLLTFATGGGDSFEKKEYWDGFGPQIGFAYAPANKWVIRGSFSLALLPPSGPYFNGVPNGFAPGFQGTNSVNSPFNWDSGYPGVFQPGSKEVDPSSLFPLVSVDPHALMPGFSDTLNIGVQYELTPTIRIEAVYIGNRGHHLPDTALAWNESDSSSFLNVVNANPGINPYNNYVFCANKGDATGLVGITCPYANFYGPALAALAPSPQAANWASSYYYYYNLNYVGLPLGQTSYNSFVVDVVKRPARGLSFDVNYTWSRQRGDTFSAQQEYNGYYTGVQDFQNLAATANSLTGYDLTHIVKGYALYQLPFGRGQKWLSDKPGWVNALVGGWQVSGLVSYYSGQPFRVGVNTPFYPLWGNFYPNFHPTGVFGPFSPSAYQAGDSSAPLYYFSQSIATSPVDGASVAFGTGGAYNSALRCPGSANENASALKSFSMGSDGQYQLQLRVEFYNLFNRHTYAILGCGGSSTNVGDGNFGQVTGVNDNPRTGQFGARFTF
jgi:Carboxypeptidase regulatory-like domain